MQVSSFIAALRLFFCFGLNGPPQFSHPDVVHKDKQFNVKLSPLVSGVSKNAENTPYRPPHLRKRDDSNSKLPVSCDWRRLSTHDSGSSDVISSDSDFSDNEGSFRDSYGAQSSKVRIAAIVCIQASNNVLFLCASHILLKFSVAVTYSVFLFFC